MEPFRRVRRYGCLVTRLREQRGGAFGKIYLSEMGFYPLRTRKRKLPFASEVKTVQMINARRPSPAEWYLTCRDITGRQICLYH